MTSKEGQQGLAAQPAFFPILVAPGRSAEIRRDADIYLEGRAIQDVWLMPERSARHPGLSADRNMYGTTLRLWDPSLSAWRITWSNPAGNHYEQHEFLARRVG
jgi:hypothetical protein